MHKLKLEFGAYAKGYCDGHERPDVIEARTEYIKIWRSLEPRMHLWFKDQDQRWRHVDEFKLKGPDSLNRDTLGEFGGTCKVGKEWDPTPSNRPLLVLFNDESTFKVKRNNPRHWKDIKEDKLRPKDGDLGAGRMISGFTEEYGGALKLTADELKACNATRNARGDTPMKYVDFCIKKFDYGKNRDGYWNTDDMIQHVIEVMDGLDAKYGEGRFQYVFLFDHSANHEAFAADALRATSMSKGWGGKQSKLRTTEMH